MIINISCKICKKRVQIDSTEYILKTDDFGKCPDCTGLKKIIQPKLEDKHECNICTDYCTCK